MAKLRHPGECFPVTYGSSSRQATPDPMTFTHTWKPLPQLHGKLRAISCRGFKFTFFPSPFCFCFRVGTNGKHRSKERSRWQVGSVGPNAWPDFWKEIHQQGYLVMGVKTAIIRTNHKNRCPFFKRAL